MILRPSSSHIWTQCPAQPTMAAMIPPEESSDPAREGTCAAWVAEKILDGTYPDTTHMLGMTHENGWLVEADMIYRIQKYVDLVRSYGGEIHTERKVKLNHLIEGTPDAFAVIASDGVLRVDDLKYGFDPVEPYRNTQISIYGGAILRMLMSRVHITSVVIGVYQPRTWHPNGIHRTWECYPEELMAFVREIEAAGELTQQPNPMCVAGSHCKYCPAAATCAAVTHLNYKTYERLCVADQRHMTPTEAVEELEFLELAADVLKGRTRAVRSEVEARIKRTEHFPGWHLEERRGNRKFTVDADTIKAITGKNPRNGKMVTPAELIRQGVNEDIVNALSESPRIPPTLKSIGKDYYTNMFKKR